MSEGKGMRKNRYRSALAKKRAIRMQHLTFCLKTAVVITVVSVASLIFIFGYDLLTQSDYFRAESLIVEGECRLTEREVVKQAGIERGINILSINLLMARSRLLAHPWIAEAEVRRGLPDEINIRIEEQSPLAVLDLERKFIINSYGEIFKEWDRSDPDNLPIVSGLKPLDIDVYGKTRSIHFDAVMDVLQLGQKPESVLPNRLIKRIDVDREMGLTLHAFDPIRAIRLGHTNYPCKYNRLKDVFFYLNSKSCFSDFDSIDLYDLNRIVIKPIRVNGSMQSAK